jgi:hypothetical protein
MIAAILELAAVLTVALLVGVYGTGLLAMVVFGDVKEVTDDPLVALTVLPFIAVIALILVGPDADIEHPDDAPQAEAQTAGTDTRDP